MKNIYRALLFLGIFMVAMQVHAGPRVSVNFGFGFPVYHSCGPRYCSPYPYPYYYSSYDYCPRHVYYEPTRVVVVHQSAPVVVESEPSIAQTEHQAGYFQLGHDWAKDMRQDIATWDQFTSYLRLNIAKTSTQNYNDFRQGFISAYGVNAESAFDKAFQQARSDVSVRQGAK